MKIPFTSEGHLYPLIPTGQDFYKHNIQVRDNIPFQDTLALDCFILVKYTVMVRLQNIDKKFTYMHLKEFEKILKNDKIRSGKITGIFKYGIDSDGYYIYMIDDIVESKDEYMDIQTDKGVF